MHTKSQSHTHPIIQFDAISHPKTCFQTASLAPKNTSQTTLQQADILTTISLHFHVKKTVRLRLTEHMHWMANPAGKQW